MSSEIGFASSFSFSSDQLSFVKSKVLFIIIALFAMSADDVANELLELEV